MPPADLERRKKEIDRKLALYGHGVSKEAQALVHKLAIKCVLHPMIPIASRCTPTNC